MCVNFRDLNKASIKDYFLLPNMEFLLHQVTGSTCMSRLDCFSGYNQVLVDGEDRAKTTFITPWETYAYARMPFGLKNVGATFQRAMDHAFNELIGNFMEDYQDDLTMHSRKIEDHIHHLRKVFERCGSYGISLNPKNCLFVVIQGKLLSHIVCKEGIYIDPERVKVVNELNPPTSKKGVQTFFRKINFFRRFDPDNASIVKPINLLLKKEKGTSGQQILGKHSIRSRGPLPPLSSSLVHIFKNISLSIHLLQRQFSRPSSLRKIATKKNYP
jgi:hypothetical protein